MTVEMRDEYPALYKRINVSRNDAWVPKLEQRLHDSHGANTLVVVGSLHLLGSTAWSRSCAPRATRSSGSAVHAANR